MACCTVSSHWDGRFMAMARDQVMTWSKDPRKQVGAILVSPDCRKVAWGYNGPPAGFDDEMLAIMDRDAKNRYTIHAEENAITNAATDVRGWTMYVTSPPCLKCAMAIHRAGIIRLVTPPLDVDSLWHAEQQEAEGFLSTMCIKQERLEC